MNKIKTNNISLFKSLLYLRQELAEAGFDNTVFSLNTSCSAFIKDIIAKGDLKHNWLSNEEFLDMLEKSAPDVYESLLDGVELQTKTDVINFPSQPKKVH